MHRVELFRSIYWWHHYCSPTFQQSTISFMTSSILKKTDQRRHMDAVCPVYPNRIRRSQSWKWDFEINNLALFQEWNPLNQLVHQLHQLHQLSAWPTLLSTTYLPLSIKNALKASAWLFQLFQLFLKPFEEPSESVWFVQRQSFYFCTWRSTLTEPIRDFESTNRTNNDGSLLLLFPFFVLQEKIGDHRNQKPLQTVSVSPEPFEGDTTCKTRKIFNRKGSEFEKFTVAFLIIIWPSILRTKYFQSYSPSWERVLWRMSAMARLQQHQPSNLTTQQLILHNPVLSHHVVVPFFASSRSRMPRPNGSRKNLRSRITNNASNRPPWHAFQ